MRQYNSIKQQVPNTLLMFRLGDFYELFYDDAVTAARELEITLTARNKEKGSAIPMCGVPYHAAEGYVARLIHKGYRVAICDQMEEPAVAKKLVKREVTRIVTPGTATDAHLLRSHENNYLAAVARAGNRAGVAHVDVSTGEFRTTEVEAADVAGTLEHLGAREVLFPADLPLLAGETPGVRFLRTELEDWIFSFDYADRTLRDHFQLLALDGCGLANRAAAVGAAGAILHYLRDTQRAALEHLDRPTFYDRAETMVLDAVTVRNLEMIEPLFAGEGETLLHGLDQTMTGMGGRLLRQRLLRPSLDQTEIEARLDAVGELLQQTILRAELRKELGGILDLERLLAKITMGTAGPRELLALGRSLERLPKLKSCFETQQALRLRMIYDKLDEVPEVRNQVLEAIADEPPVNITDGGTIRAGFNTELDELRDLSLNGRQVIAQIEARERTRTGIGSLKVRFNNVFGYYIEISKANLHAAPADYERKQTLVNAERFTTPELKDYERKVLDAEDKILTLEKELFAEVRKFAAAHAQRIKTTASAIAELDVTAALAQVAAQNHYTRPTFSADGEMRIAGGRHPVIERLSQDDAGRFIPNDLYLNSTSDLIAIITGPNMGGKSTYLRQAALIVILAQMGSFVPADTASLTLVDRVFTRIGASDNLSRGRSTFMVEMTETAVILNTATPRSLIVLDEIGRGTATYDGLALAWAVVEHIHQHTRAKTLFATHYHELTELAEQLEGVRNLQVAVKESGDHIIFLRKVEPGKADRSYGIEVARLAGLPRGVIHRAREVLKLHEKTEHVVTEELTPRPAGGPVQIRLFEPVDHNIAERIRELKLDELRPIEALKLLAELQEELKALVRVAGIMSGTSLDGIDVAVVDIRGRKIETVAFRSTPYPKRVRDAILAVSNTTTTTAAIARLNFELGELYARAVQATVPLGELDLIGCHGQTIYHEGGKCTLQIGEGSVIAERTRIPVVSDFRTADIAAGGQGAPLVPFVDYLLFRHPRRHRIALNIGGIANITAIPAGARPDEVIAFDTGPGNMAIDALVSRHSGGKQNYDRNGRIAAGANVDQPLLDRLLSEPYYRQKPPKNAGREQYGQAFIERLTAGRTALPDLIATATVLTAATVALGVRRFSAIEAGDLIVSGGGAHNPQIMAHLAGFLPRFSIATTSDYGVDVDAKEAIAFAVLAHETWRRRPSNLPSATGARHPAVLGKVSYPS